MQKAEVAKGDRMFQYLDGSHRPIKAETIANIVKKAMQEAGIDTEYYKPHFVRGGSATTAVTLGAPSEIAMSRGHWRSAETYREHYGRAHQAVNWTALFLKGEFSFNTDRHGREPAGEAVPRHEPGVFQLTKTSVPTARNEAGEAGMSSKIEKPPAHPSHAGEGSPPMPRPKTKPARKKLTTRKASSACHSVGWCVARAVTASSESPPASCTTSGRTGGAHAQQPPKRSRPCMASLTNTESISLKPFQSRRTPKN
eukprot:TRINITY_DN7362_c0_g1_i18.p1 TRINITY_DN7362_c0_g1~~TRINITY_DN7362_c0_g1_i18.p1  ORF type:complete len:255 (-),score=9.85 TRINITY_DN7362_c0_g1_i18:39-803(-)